MRTINPGLKLFQGFLGVTWEYTLDAIPLQGTMHTHIHTNTRQHHSSELIGRWDETRETFSKSEKKFKSLNTKASSGQKSTFSEWEDVT